MALTSSQSEKFAFLFSGSVTSRYLNDLERVYTTLADYYGYPANKIWVVFGSTPVLTGYTGLSGAPNTSVLSGSDLPLSLQTAFEAFATDATTPWADPPEPTNVALIYCTGLGGNTGGSQLDISGAGSFAAGTFVTPAWFNSRFTTAYPHTPVNRRFAPTAFVHLVMQQEFSGGFLSCINTVSSLIWSFTSACGSTEPSIGLTDGDASGGYFTLGWTNALRFVKNAAGKFADELPTIDLLYHIQLQQAHAYAANEQYGSPLHPLPQTPAWGTSGEVHYLGLPVFFIRDGDDQAVPDYWYESPDIYIDTPGNDRYNVGVDNTVHILTKNVGTHPVRSFWVGAKHFGSGIGQTYAIHIENRLIGSGLASVFKPGEIHDFSYLQLFDVTTTETHRCIKARAKLTEILDAEIDEYMDWSDTLIQENDFEAQRNVDPVDLGGGSPVEPAPAPGAPENPDPNPLPDPEEDENNTGDRSLRNIRGIKEHIFTIVNPFKEKRKFKIVLHKDFLMNTKFFSIKFFKFTGGEKPGLEPLRIISLPYQYIILEIDSLKKIDILFYLALKPKAKITKEIRLPIEILVEKKGRKRIKNLRKSTLVKVDSSFIPVSGITVKVKMKDLSIKGTVFNRDKKPVPGAKIFIRSVNHRQAAVLITDEKGKYIMPRINPDSYKMYAKTNKWQTKQKVVNLLKNDLIIDFSENELPGKKRELK